MSRILPSKAEAVDVAFSHELCVVEPCEIIRFNSSIVLGYNKFTFYLPNNAHTDILSIDCNVSIYAILIRPTLICTLRSVSCLSVSLDQVVCGISFLNMA